MISGIGDVIGHHHGKLEGQCILKGTDIQAKPLLQLFKTVHQSIPVHIELSGGFRKVQVKVRMILRVSSSIDSRDFSPKISPTNMLQT